MGAPRQGPWKAALFVFCLDWLLMSGSYTLMFPFLPVYLKNDLGCPPEDLTFWSSACFSVQFVFSALLSPFWGRIADRFGRKLMLLRASSMLAIAYFICMIVQTPFQLFLARIFMGFACGITPVILSMNSDIVPKDKLGFSMGLLQSMNILGSVVGPLAGGAIAQYLSVRLTFAITTAALATVTVVSLIFIHEPPRAAAPAPAPGAHGGGALSVLRQGPVLCVLLAASAGMMIMMLPVSILTPYIVSLAHGSTHGIVLSGAVFSLYGIAGALTSPLWGTLGQRRGFFNVLVLSMLLSALASAGQALPQSVAWFAAANFAAGVCLAGIVPMVNALLVRATRQGERTAAFGLLYSFSEVGSGSGPIVGGLIASAIAPRATFLCSSALLALAALALLRLAPKVLRRRGA
ncbi:MAG: MFS transporter [Aeromonadales bacterium]|nr:MFS transporter [Aeromonadales bacterium]MDY2890798.1 MFS transporter [Succinivibrio sp.]